MIEKVLVENFFGIKKFQVDFRLKNKIKSEVFDLDDQIVSVDGTNIALFPSFIAKNASGKTSFIKAIDFAMRFINEKSFFKQMVHFSTWMLEEKNKLSIRNTGELNINFSFAEKVIKSLFDEISFAGSDFSNIELTLTKKRTAKIEITKESFYIVLTNGTIDVLELLSTIEDGIIYENFETRRAAYKSVEALVKNTINKKEIEFYTAVNCQSIFRGNKSVIQMREIFLKNITRKHMETIIAAFGFEAFKTLLTKIDSHISTVSWDPETKTFDLFLKGIDVPISPKRLSFGTAKIIEIISKSITLFKEGGVMMIDEIENGLHLSLIKLIVKLYEDDEVNLAKAQLFITTHNPSIFEERIIKEHNVFIHDEDEIISLKEANKKDKNGRPENRQSMVKTKNYFNDSFWKSKKLEPKSTINNLKINLIINSISEGGVWQKR